MSSFTIIVILGVLMIIGGISLMATPLLTFLSAGYFIIMLFFVRGVFGIVRGIHEKRYDKEFVFSIISLILGIIGLAVPGVAAMNNAALLYMAAGWFFIHGVLTIMDALDRNKQGAGVIVTVIGVLLGVLELILFGYSVAHPMVLAIGIGVLVGFFFLESGVSMIFVGSAISGLTAAGREIQNTENISE